MRVTMIATVVAAVLAAPAMAQDQAGIAATINGQMDAFRADDDARAFNFASPFIKGVFGSPENFGAMVAQGYPMVNNPADVRMLELREVAGNLWQRVMVTDQGGRTHILDYQMIETPEGWQINGVQLLPEAGVGA